MTDDLLRRATSALRDETEDSQAGARFTRARVLASLNETRVRRRTRLTFLLPLAACFAAATAWGTSGGNAGRLFAFVSHAFQSDPAPAPVPRAKPSKPVSKAPVVPPAETPEPSVVADADVTPLPPPAVPALPEPERAPVRVARASIPVSSSAASNPAVPSARVADPAHDLYRAAHRAHFVEHEPAKALSAWNSYLRAAPAGRFSLEARYNRALCLVRLGRHEEARAALSPFAAGSHGEYRQAEAQALLNGLGSVR
jgi:hypothetical protein